jgi:exosortase E/protease (VPEID-CTERM system)
VNSQSSIVAAPHKYSLGLPVRVAILGAIFFAEKIFLNHFVDFDRAQAAQGVGAFVRNAQHWGFRFLVAFAGAVALFAYVRGGRPLEPVDTAMRSRKLRAGWALAHVLLIACLIPLSYFLYRDGATSLPFAAIVVLWIACAIGASLSAILAMAAAAEWIAAVRALGIIWVYAAAAAVLGASAIQLSQQLWQPTAALTFELVRRLLLPFIPDLSADAATRVLSTDRFAVEVSEVCSGLEGMGLMLAFTAAWLLYFRREYIFPRALVLIPAGLATMFALNVVRIAALMLIGYGGFPEVAAYGFHSQAGWIAFTTVACALVFFSRRSAWLNRAAIRHDAPAAAAHNPTGTYLLPLLAILAAGALSHAMSGRFERFYPLRLAAGLAALAFYRRELAAIDWRWSWRGPAVGAAIFLLWIAAAHLLLPWGGMPAELMAMSPGARAAWIASRLASGILIVPIAEELAYRGFLLRRLYSPDFESVSFSSVGWPALGLTAVVFGLAHGALWLPGIAAGLAYGLLVMRRGTLGEAVAAHLTSNALIGATVLGFGQWQLW